MQPSWAWLLLLGSVCGHGAASDTVDAQGAFGEFLDWIESGMSAEHARGPSSLRDTFALGATEKYGNALFALRRFEKGDTVVVLPGSRMLRKELYGKVPGVSEKAPDEVRLAIYLLLQREAGPSAKFYHYIRNLPASEHHWLPSHWPEDLYNQHMQGSHFQRFIEKHERAREADYETWVPSDLKVRFSRDDYRWAVDVVRSRTTGGQLLPFSDLMSHGEYAGQRNCKQVVNLKTGDVTITASRTIRAGEMLLHFYYAEEGHTTNYQSLEAWGFATETTSPHHQQALLRISAEDARQVAEDPAAVRGEADFHLQKQMHVAYGPQFLAYLRNLASKPGGPSRRAWDAELAALAAGRQLIKMALARYTTSVEEDLEALAEGAFEDPRVRFMTIIIKEEKEVLEWWLEYLEKASRMAVPRLVDAKDARAAQDAQPAEAAQAPKDSFGEFLDWIESGTGLDSAWGRSPLWEGFALGPTRRYGNAVFSKRHFDKGDAVFVLPGSRVLRRATYANIRGLPEKTPDDVKLAIYLLLQRQAGPSAKFYHYIRHLPTSQLHDHPGRWPKELFDKHMQGSQFPTAIIGGAGTWAGMYDKFVPSEFKAMFSRDEFRWATDIVRSRSLTTSKFNIKDESVLLPFVDFLNHGEHDAQRNCVQVIDSRTGDVTLRALRTIRPGDPLFHSYYSDSEKLTSNYESLGKWGFATELTSPRQQQVLLGVSVADAREVASNPAAVRSPNYFYLEKQMHTANGPQFLNYLRRLASPPGGLEPDGQPVRAWKVEQAALAAGRKLLDRIFARYTTSVDEDLELLARNDFEDPRVRFMTIVVKEEKEVLLWWLSYLQAASRADMHRTVGVGHTEL